MASVAACRAAIKELGERLSGAGDDVRMHVEDRTISCRLLDLDVVLSGRLSGGQLLGVTTRVPTEPAQIRLTCSSDSPAFSVPRSAASSRLVSAALAAPAAV